MQLSSDDRFMLKLTAWRENRAGGEVGMQSVMNVILNRAAKRGESVFEVCTARLQFSSITALGDPETVAFAQRKELADWAMWQVAETLAARAETGNLPDLTGGAVDYYAPAGLAAAERSSEPYTLPTNGQLVPFPKTWNRERLRYTGTFAHQFFFAEV